MNRRRFFGALAGLAVAPTVLAVPLMERADRVTWWSSAGIDYGAQPAVWYPYVVWNDSPWERGASGSRYLVMGWVVSKDGWEEVRCLTGK